MEQQYPHLLSMSSPSLFATISIRNHLLSSPEGPERGFYPLVLVLQTATQAYRDGLGDDDGSLESLLDARTAE